MASEHAVIIEESLRIPADALTFEGFRSWAQSPEFPTPGGSTIWRGTWRSI